jgi:hypothetical protein
MFYLRKYAEKKFREKIELFDEKTDEIVRKIHFRSSKDFDKFLEDFTLMRYPGYRWRYVDKKKEYEDKKKDLEG